MRPSEESDGIRKPAPEIKMNNPIEEGARGRDEQQVVEKQGL